MISLGATGSNALEPVADPAVFSVVSWLPQE